MGISQKAFEVMYEKSKQECDKELSRGYEAEVVLIPVCISKCRNGDEYGSVAYQNISDINIK